MQLFDLDNNVGFETVLSKLSDYSTRNFVVRFDAAQAKCAVDVPFNKLAEAIAVDSDSSPISSRWLNLWSYGYSDREAVLAILASYGVSRRLTHLLCPQTLPTNRARAKQEHVAVAKVGTSDDDLTESVSPEADTPYSPPLDDVGEQQAAILSMNHVMKDMWHFCSIDWGHRYTCISYNSLFTATSAERNVQSRQPEAIRIWSAIILFDDGLVISNFESPPGLPLKQLKMIRKNQVNVLKNLSWQYDPNQMEANVFQVDVRPVKPGAGVADAADFDAVAAASRIFYYLFDDWRATFELVSGRHHPYRQRLDEVRARMSKAPSVEDVEKLHQLGQQLVVLQRVYEGYEKIVDRLLQRQRQLSTSSWRTAQRSQSQLPLLNRQASSDTQRAALDQTVDVPAFITESDNDQRTVRLPLGTVARFERLLDRIRLYALKEIEECAAEKEALVLLTFNLVNMKNATAIERLTRTTILLAKVTILFLPVSLMTAYFGLSMQAIDQMYSIRTYWVCFGIVGALTSILLLGYTFANSRVGGQITYQSLTRMLLQGMRKRAGGGAGRVGEARKVV